MELEFETEDPHQLVGHRGSGGCGKVLRGDGAERSFLYGRQRQLPSLVIP